jgi:GNAT superfamily N-acetyltransferase
MTPTESKSIKQVLQELISLRYDKTNEPPDKILAFQFGEVSPSAFSNYRQGKRKPNQANAKIMGVGWAKTLLEDPENHTTRLPRAKLDDRLRAIGLKPERLADQIQARLMDATIGDEFGVDDGESFLDKLAGKETTLRVSCMDYGLFVDSKEDGSGFFNEVYSRYTTQLGVPVDLRARQPFDVPASLNRGDTHVALCYFESVERSLSVRFFKTPLRVSLGVLCNSIHKSLTKEIAESISQAAPAMDRRMQFLAVEHEVGDLFLRQGMRQGRFLDYERIKTTDELTLARRLVAMGQVHQAKEIRHQDLTAQIESVSKTKETKVKIEALQAELQEIVMGDIPVPLLVVDEYTALRVLRIARENGLQLHYVMPLTTLRNNRDLEYRRRMPLHQMSFACGGAHAFREFAEFLRHSLHTFFSSEVQTTARALADLFHKLEKEIFEISKYLTAWDKKEGHTDRPLKPLERKLLARQYALFALSLEETAAEAPLVSPPWKRILIAARNLIHRDWLGKDREGQAEEFIALIAPEDEGNRITKGQQVDDLNVFFDLDRPFKVDEVRGLDTRQILTEVQSKLLGEKAVRREIEIEEFDPGTASEAEWGSLSSPRVNAVQALSTKLLDMYRSIDPLPRYDRSLIEGLVGSHGFKQKVLVSTILERTRALKEVIEQRILNTLFTCCKRYSGENGRIFLAAEQPVPSGTPRYIGMVFVRTRPGLWRENAEENFPADFFGFDETLDSEEVRKDLEKTCELRYLWIEKDYRNRQVARLLISKAEQWCREKQYRYIQFGILPQLQNALNLAERMGYEPKKVRTTFDDRDAPNSLIFIKALSPPY